jgi:hypothetical protein
LAYFHQGTPKHWVADGVLNNLLAWGEHTDAIGNRNDLSRWPKTFDQRLRGRHTLVTAVYPYAGAARPAELISLARSFNQPLVAVVARGEGGRLPTQQKVLVLADQAVAATAVMVQGNQLACRLYSTGEATPVTVAPVGLRPTGLWSLDGAALPALGPFQIGTLNLTPARPAILE